MRLPLSLAGRRLPVDLFFFFLLFTDATLVRNRVFFKLSPEGKIDCMASITGLKTVLISSFFDFSFLLCFPRSYSIISVVD